LRTAARSFVARESMEKRRGPSRSRAPIYGNAREVEILHQE
jgi:hypothetical protein